MGAFRLPGEDRRLIRGPRLARLQTGIVWRIVVQAVPDDGVYFSATGGSNRASEKNGNTLFKKYGAWLRLGLGSGCLLMAALSFLGVGTQDEPNGRVIFGLLWLCVGVLWFVRYFINKRRPPENE